MRKALMLLILTSFTCIGYSQQVNRYSKPAQTATFNPVDYSSLSTYSEAESQRRSGNIHDSAENLYDRVYKYIIDTQDPIFKRDLIAVKPYLRPLLDPDRRMSLRSAQWYYKKARNKFNKAIKNYNKRLKKKQ